MTVHEEKWPPGPWKVAQPWAGFSELRDRDGNLIFGLAAGSAEEKQPDDALEAAAHLIEASDTLYDALEKLQALISEGAEFGFNPLEGDWADRLFVSQQETSRALASARGDGV